MKLLATVVFVSVSTSWVIEAVLARTKPLDVNALTRLTQQNRSKIKSVAHEGKQRGLRTPDGCGKPEMRGITGRNGHERRYSRLLPCDTRPSFAILALHGYTGGEDWLAHSFLDIYGPLAQEYGFIFIAPEGLPGGALSSWNADVCCGEALERGYDDLGFLQLLVKAESNGLPVFGVGFGNGGFMLSKVVRDKPGLLAGMAVFAGHVYEGLNWIPHAQTATLMYYSRADFAVRPGGCCQDPNSPKCTEPGISQRGPKECVSVNHLFDFWKGSNRCTGEKTTETVQQRFGGTQICREGTGCALPTRLCEYTGVQVDHNAVVDATDPREVVSFFQQSLSDSRGKSAACLFSTLLFSLFAPAHLLMWI